MPPSVLDLPPRRKVARSFYRRWTWRRQLIASGTRLLIVLLLGVLVWGGWYLGRHGGEFGLATHVAFANHPGDPTSASSPKVEIKPENGGKS